MELRDYINVIRARKWVIIQAVLIVTLTALVVSLVQTPVYESEAQILIAETGTSSDIFGDLGISISSSAERGLSTQVQLMQVRPLLENTIAELDLGMTPEDLAEKVEVSAVGQTNIVTIVAKDDDPEVAAAVANTLADEFVAWSQDYNRESINAAAAEVEERLEAAKAEILSLGQEISDQGKSDELSAELAIATGNYTTLASKLEELRIQSQLETGAGRIVSPAVTSTSPVEPSPVRNTALGLVVGLVFGLGMAFLYEYLDNTIKSASEVEELTAAPLIGSIPSEKYEKDTGRRATILTHPASAAAEAYRVLRNNLDFINFEHNISTLLVASAAPTEGKSTLSANLAASLAQAGRRVVLVSCDFRKPTTEQFFGVRNLIGLSDVLTGAHTLKSALQKPREDMSLLVLTSGKLPPNPSELLGSEKMRDLLEALKEWGDWVIIDTPPLLAVADAAAVARWCDGALLITHAGHSTRDAVKRAREMLDKVGARVLGSVVWGLESRAGGGSYGYNDGSYYSYADYYNTPAGEGGEGKRGRPATKADGARGKTGSRTLAERGNGARGVYLPAESLGRRVSASTLRIITGVMAVLAIVLIAALVLYFVDQATGWSSLGSLLGS